MIRWVLASIFAIGLAAVLYFGSSAYALKQIGEAAASGRTDEVIARTNLVRLRRSLADQALAAYDRKSGKPKPSNSLRQMLINNVEANIADAMVARLLTPDRLIELLTTGRIGAEGTMNQALTIPALGNIQIGDALSRFHIVNPVTTAFRIDRTAEGERTELLMHFEASHWKLAGLKLPPAIVDRLVERIQEQRTTLRPN